jgi:hypothetical protein
MILKFTEWLPDQPSMSGALIDAKNVYPVAAGYSPFPSSVDYSSAASENIRNIFVGRYGGDTQVFAGGATKLFKLDASDLSMDDKSKSGGYSGTGQWKFAQFGKQILAVNNSEVMQSWEIGSSSIFADISGSPICKYVTVIRDFVVTGNIGSDTNKIQWSDVNDETDWVSGTTSQSDYQFIPDGGNITGLTGGEFGLVFLERAIVRMSYVGSPLFFQLDTISRGLGCLDGNAVAQYGSTSFFLSDDGFYKTDGQSIQGIGTEKIDRWFFNDVKLVSLDTMTTAIEPTKKLVVWNYENVDGGRTMLAFNWQINKWSRISTDATVVGTIAATGTTLEGLDTLYPSIDAMPASLDDRLFMGGKYLFAGAKDTKLTVFTGFVYDSELITTDIESGYNSVVTLARPQVDNGSADVKVASRRELDDLITFGTSVSTSSEGRANLRSAGRYHRVSVKPTGSWTTAMAVDVDIKPQGNR